MSTQTENGESRSTLATGSALSMDEQNLFWAALAERYDFLTTCEQRCAAINSTYRYILAQRQPQNDRDEPTLGRAEDR